MKNRAPRLSRAPRLGRHVLVASVAFFQALAVGFLGACAGCSGPTAREAPPRLDEDEPAGSSVTAISSAAARILDLSFEAEVIAASDVDARKAVVSQLMYTQGILMSAGNGNAHVGNVQLSDVVESPAGANNKRIGYRAVLPVAWPRDKDAPDAYELVLPRDTTQLDAFNATYDGRCGHAAHGREAFWFDWNPTADGCSLDDGDVHRSRATVARSSRETMGRYPEYDLVWSDDRLDVVALFAVIVETSPRDWAFVAARSFLRDAQRRLRGPSVTTRSASSSVLADTTVTGTITVAGRERDVRIDVLVVPKLSEAGADFEERYTPLSARADLVLYNGHAGLGAEVAAFARTGEVTAGKYQIVLLNGCQTFAYVDTTLADRRRDANGADDPNGTRYLDVVANALTSRTENFVMSSVSLLDAALTPDVPRSYREILAAMPSDQIAVVFGEEDNVYSP